MDKKLLQQFEILLNDAISIGWKPFGDNLVKDIEIDKDYDDQINYYLQSRVSFNSSYNDLFFWKSWFLDMIKRKQVPFFDWKWYIIDWWEYSKKQHKCGLVLLESDELRIQYVLNNHKWFITNTKSWETLKELTE